MKKEGKGVRVPARFRGIGWLTGAWLVYALIWIALEGAVWQVVAMGVSTTAVFGGRWVQRRWGGHSFSARHWLGRTAVFGLAAGAGSGLLTLGFMILKTGLHAHGPEFTPAEIAWVIRQIPLWTIVGGLGGLGAGLVTLGIGEN